MRAPIPHYSDRGMSRAFNQLRVESIKQVLMGLARQRNIKIFVLIGESVVYWLGCLPVHLTKVAAGKESLTSWEVSFHVQFVSPPLWSSRYKPAKLAFFECEPECSPVGFSITSWFVALTF